MNNDDRIQNKVEATTVTNTTKSTDFGERKADYQQNMMQKVSYFIDNDQDNEEGEQNNNNNDLIEDNTNYVTDNGYNNNNNNITDDGYTPNTNYYDEYDQDFI